MRKNLTNSPAIQIRFWLIFAIITNTKSVISKEPFYQMWTRFVSRYRSLKTCLKGNEDKNIVMYCTGGIRCEKASAWYKNRGFKNVHQLEGGIIKYANECREKGLENKFLGKNFVFDERRGERITDEIISKCHQCG